MPVRPTLSHRMALVSFLLFRKNLGNLREFFGQIVYRPPWQKIARTPMPVRDLPILNCLQYNRAYVSSASYGCARLFILIVQIISEQVSELLLKYRFQGFF